MFVPIEGALAAALRQDPELFSYAWARHVVLVGPATLVMTMRTVDSIWRYERQGENTQEIARLAGHSSSRTTETIYRRELRPVITTGAEIMDQIFAG